MKNKHFIKNEDRIELIESWINDPDFDFKYNVPSHLKHISNKEKNRILDEIFNFHNKEQAEYGLPFSIKELMDYRDYLQDKIEKKRRSGFETKNTELQAQQTEIQRKGQEISEKSLMIQDNSDKTSQKALKISENLEKSNKISIFLAIITVIIIFANAWIANETLKTNNDMANQTTIMADINQRMLELEGPYLSIWQPTKTIRQAHNFIGVNGFDYNPKISVCIRNDGKTSTGPVSIQRNPESEYDFAIENKSYENFASHEGNCTTIGINYCYKNNNSYRCDETIVPRGNITIPIIVTCYLCRENKQYKNITIEIN